MPAITASLFATQQRSNGPEESLIAHALLFEGGRPYWEIHIGGKIFRFISNPDFLLEDGLWQLNSYTQIPESEYQYDVSENEPISIEEEFGEADCQEARQNISKLLTEKDIHFKLVTWPGVWIPELDLKIKKLKAAGVNITAA